jgi:hypothetical protein
LRIWAAVRRRESALSQPAIGFEAAIPARIRADERFQIALEDAETAESLERAMALRDAEIKNWAAKGFTLLRAVEAADDAYEHEIVEAFAAFRAAMKGSNGAPNGA